ncbi:hypothetical protein [Micromonospora echinospora]|nr:hypothetical protein [Micromonospora echinospora]
MNTSAREIADGYRAADSYAGAVSVWRQILGSAAVFCGAVSVGLATSSVGPILRAVAMLAFLSGFVGMVRLFVVGLRLDAELDPDPRTPEAVKWWFWLFTLRDVVTPRSRWRVPRRDEGVN